MGGFIAVAAIILIFIVVSIIFSRQEDRRFKKEGKAVEGEILFLRIDVISEKNRSSITVRTIPKYYIAFRYRYDGREYVRSLYVRQDLYNKLQVGGRLSLLCLASKPGKYRIVDGQ